LKFPQGIRNHIDVESVDEYFANIERFGGKVEVPKSQVPNMGYFAICSVK
jgi:predicted enzyme related to lactoylglutathione lyase